MDFIEILGMQKQLDEEISMPRKSGFVPRERTLFDIKGALDDEFQEWWKELPDEYNFKTWKEKTYNRDKELVELVDCLFFFLQLVNMFENFKNYEEFNLEKHFCDFENITTNKNLKIIINEFKYCLWNNDLIFAFRTWIKICNLRGFTREEIIQAYIKKWKQNIGERPNGDWSLGGNK